MENQLMKVLYDNMIALSGRPVRDIIISQDDITNLKIELALCQDINQFIMAI